MELISGAHHTVALLLLTSDLRSNIPPHFSNQLHPESQRVSSAFYVQIGENTETGEG